MRSCDGVCSRYQKVSERTKEFIQYPTLRRSRACARSREQILKAPSEKMIQDSYARSLRKFPQHAHKQERSNTHKVSRWLRLSKVAKKTTNVRHTHTHTHTQHTRTRTRHPGADAERHFAISFSNAVLDAKK